MIPDGRGCMAGANGQFRRNKGASPSLIFFVLPSFWVQAYGSVPIPVLWRRCFVKRHVDRDAAEIVFPYVLMK